MANEATVQSSLKIRVGNINYQSLPASFNADVVGVNGPAPGAMTVTPDGVDVDLSQLITPGFCRIMNLDEDNFVEYGIREPATGQFYPLGEVLPGESYVLRFSRNLQEQYSGTGTGTTAATNFFHIKADTANCVVVVEAFEA